MNKNLYEDMTEKQRESFWMMRLEDLAAAAENPVTKDALLWAVETLEKAGHGGRVSERMRAAIRKVARE